MARVILDVPSEKIRSFLHLISKLGIEKHSISSSFFLKKKGKLSDQEVSYKISHQRLPGYSWEFFKNELEFE